MLTGYDVSAGHTTGLVAGQEHRNGRDVLGSHQQFRLVVAPASCPCQLISHSGMSPAHGDCVDIDVKRLHLQSQTLGEHDHARFGNTVGGEIARGNRAGTG